MFVKLKNYLKTSFFATEARRHRECGGSVGLAEVLAREMRDVVLFLN